jgi:hypothetical protein
VEISDVVWYPQKEHNKAVPYPGLSIEIPLSEYRSEIVNFAVKAKEFFIGVEKIIKDKFDREWYKQFWDEYNQLLEKYRDL